VNSPISSAVVANPWLAQTARIEAITPELAGVATYHLRLVDPQVDAGYRFEPGQFNMLYVPGVGEIAIGVSTGSCVSTGSSISSGPESRGTWDHTVRLAGQVSTALAELGCGATLGLRGPYGSSWPLAASAGADVLLVAGGTGLASLRGALYALLQQRKNYGQVTLLYGARSPETLLYQSEYLAWTQQGLMLETTVDRSASNWQGNVGVVPQLIDRLQPLTPANTVIFCCGPEVMMRYTIRSAIARGLRKDQIWVSLERNMQCAVGLCGHCQLGPELICRDGPTYRYDRVEPYLNVESL
jgi:NAD(P)H-flavin reductase